MHEVGGHATALRWGIEADAEQPVPERMGDPERLLGLVLERVDEHDPGYVLAEVPIEREGRLDRVAEDEHERVGHRAGRRQPGQPRSGGRRSADATAHDRRVVEDVGDVRMDVTGTEADDRLGGGDVDDLPRGRRPAGRLGEHPEERRLVQPELAIAAADPEDDLLGVDAVAVGQRLDRGLRRGPRSASTWPSRFFASSMPHRTASCRVNTSIVTNGSRPSAARMLSARAK